MRFIARMAASWLWSKHKRREHDCLKLKSYVFFRMIVSLVLMIAFPNAKPALKRTCSSRLKRTCTNGVRLSLVSGSRDSLMADEFLV
jgi:hypothetical protein